MKPLALVLSGGNALGAYHAGAWAALEAAAITPSWIAGTSIGAVTAAIIAGNPPSRRAAALRHFWQRAASPAGLTAWAPAALQKPLQYGSALATRLFGRSSIFHTRLPTPVATAIRPGLYDPAPMRALIAELVDLSRLNDGAMRVSVLAVDLETGQDVVFDTARDRLELDHIMASAALIPDFPAVPIAGRLLVDGGFWANLPTEIILAEPQPDGIVCITVDCLPAAAPPPQDVLEAAQRQTDLIFACQSARTLRWASALWAGEHPGATLVPVVYEAMDAETALKGFDFSSASIARRMHAGEADMARALALAGMASARANLAAQPG